MDFSVEEMSFDLAAECDGYAAPADVERRDRFQPISMLLSRFDAEAVFSKRQREAD